MLVRNLKWIESATNRTFACASKAFEQYLLQNVPNGAFLTGMDSLARFAAEGEAELVIADERRGILRQVIGAWIRTHDGNSAVISLPHSADLEVLDIANWPEPWAMNGVQVTSEGFAVRVVGQAPEDRPAADFIDTLELAKSFTSVTEKKPSLEPIASMELIERYRASLELIGKYSAMAEELRRNPLSNDEERASQDTDALVNEIRTLRAAHAQLEKRYTALANSRLGSWTLKRWEKGRQVK